MIQSIVTVLIGIIVILVGINLLLRIKKLTSDGIEAEGVIFEFERFTHDRSNASFPVVRFVTKEKEWITKTCKISVIPWMHKVGDKVTVLYENGNTSNFIIKEKATYIMPIILIVVASIVFIVGLYLFITQYHSLS